MNQPFPLDNSRPVVEQTNMNPYQQNQYIKNMQYNIKLNQQQYQAHEIPLQVRYWYGIDVNRHSGGSKPEKKNSYDKRNYLSRGQGSGGYNVTAAEAK